MAIIAVIEPPVLLAVDRIVSGVEVQHDLLGRLLVRLDEMFDQHFRHSDQRFAIYSVLQSAQRRRRSQWLPGVGRLARGHL